MGYVEDLRKFVGHETIILPGSTILVFNQNYEILLQERIEPKGKWGLPGGLMELNESTEETAKRELKEETNLDAHELVLLGVYSGKDYYVKLKNGDQYFSLTIAYTCVDWSGELINNENEGTSLRFFGLDDLPSYIVASHKRMILDFKKKTNPLG